MIEKRILRTGDGSHKISKEMLNAEYLAPNSEQRDLDHFWGWNDEMLTDEDKKDVTIINKTNS